MHFIPDKQIWIKNCLSGLGFIRNKTGFGTAVHQLILVQMTLSPDEPLSIALFLQKEKTINFKFASISVKKRIHINLILVLRDKIVPLVPLAFQVVFRINPSWHIREYSFYMIKIKIVEFLCFSRFIEIFMKLPLIESIQLFINLHQE